MILVPGVTGVMLRNRVTGRILWGRGANLLRPHDGGYGVARPLDPATDSPIEAFAVLERLHIGPLRKVVYGRIADLLEANGYRRGDLGHPERGGDLFLFAYDWRQDNVASTRLLAEELEGLRRARGLDRLPVILLCQSNGSYLCRYLAKYGGADLETAEAGRAGPPAHLAIRSILLVGTSNGGSLRILRELDRGRRYVPGVGRKWQPETLFTFASLYEDLPTYRSDLFVDGAGRPLDVDLYDAATWERYGWSIFGEKARRRLARHPRPEVFGDLQTRRAFLQTTLDRARRFQRLLARDVPDFGPTRYYLIQNPFWPTPERAVLKRSASGWRMLFTGDREVERTGYLRSVVTAAGDGHATVASQLWLSPQERQALVGEVFRVDGEHFELILASETLQRLLEILEENAG